MNCNSFCCKQTCPQPQITHTHTHKHKQKHAPYTQTAHRSSRGTSTHPLAGNVCLTTSSTRPLAPCLRGRCAQHWPVCFGLLKAALSLFSQPISLWHCLRTRVLRACVPLTPFQPAKPQLHACRVVADWTEKAREAGTLHMPVIKAQHQESFFVAEVRNELGGVVQAQQVRDKRGVLARYVLVCIHAAVE